MANNITVLNPKLWQSDVQDYLTNLLIAMDVAMTKFSVGLSFGSEIEFPELSDVFLETYVPGTDLTPQPIIGASSVLQINTSKGAAVTIDDIQKLQAKADYQVALKRQIAYQLANDIDASVISTGVSGAALTGTNSSTLDASSMFDVLLEADNVLFRNNAYSGGGEKFAIMGPKFKNLLAKTFVANGFQIADATLRNGFVGSANDFKCYVSNNIPSSVSLTMSVLPTANDTITLFGVTWTFVASATNAGEITYGANAGEAQTNLKAAINATGGSNYVDVSQENRSILKNRRATVGTWGANVAAITGLGYIGGSETFTSASNVFGTETTKILFGVKGAIAVAMQKQPTLSTSDIPLQVGIYLKGIDLYGTKVFSRSARRLYALTVNA